MGAFRESLSLDWLFFRCLQLRTINLPKWHIWGWHILVPFGRKMGGRGQRGERKKPGGCGAWQERFAFSRKRVMTSVTPTPRGQAWGWLRRVTRRLPSPPSHGHWSASPALLTEWRRTDPNPEGEGGRAKILTCRVS